MSLPYSPEQSMVLWLKHTERNMKHGPESNLSQRRTLKTSCLCSQRECCNLPQPYHMPFQKWTLAFTAFYRKIKNLGLCMCTRHGQIPAETFMLIALRFSYKAGNDLPALSRLRHSWRLAQDFRHLQLWKAGKWSARKAWVLSHLGNSWKRLSRVTAFYLLDYYRQSTWNICRLFVCVFPW